ncbi:MAG: S1 family peptidase [Bdellovibrio sp.]|jgi:secreted trypsin-like serine protease
MSKLMFSVCLMLFFGLTACSGSSESKGETTDTLYCDANAGEKQPAAGEGIFGGRRVHKDSWIARGVVAILTKNSRGGISICTGTLIDRNLVLTAAHCVDRYEIASRTQVMFTAEPLCTFRANNAGALNEVSAVRIHRGYNASRFENDMAMIRLSRPAPAEYRTLSLVNRPFAITKYTPVLLTGYGTQSDYNTSARNDPHDLKYTHIVPYSGPLAAKSILPMATSPLLYFDQRNGSGACVGDSGGPALARNEAGKYQVIGVASKVDELDQPEFERQQDVSCKTGIAHSSVSYYQIWIEETFKQLRNSDSLRQHAFD